MARSPKPARRRRRSLHPLAAQLDRMAQKADDPLVRRWLRQFVRKGAFRGPIYADDSGR